MLSKSAITSAGQMRFDVAVLGAGISGACAAVELARSGLRVALLGEPANAKVLDSAETLSSAAKPWLEYLDIWTDFKKIGALPLVASQSLWGGGAHSKSSLPSPYGSDWIIPKINFINLLHEHAKKYGVHISWCRWNKVQSHSPGDEKSIYSVEIDQPPHSIFANAIIDASGHRACAARQLDAERKCIFHQTAQIWNISTPKILTKPWSFTFSHSKGWIYAATSAHSGHSISLFSAHHSRQEASHKISNRMAVNKMTSNSQIKDILKVLEHKMKIYDIESILKDQRPTLRSATSSSTWPVANKHWVAIGDAACTLDPLSSTGLLHAIRSACKGARAIKNSLNGNFSDLESYSKMTNQFFQKYISERQQIYLNSKITL